MEAKLAKLANLDAKLDSLMQNNQLQCGKENLDANQQNSNKTSKYSNKKRMRRTNSLTAIPSYTKLSKLNRRKLTSPFKI